MNELMQSSLQFPTVLFTIALGIALVYWLFVVLGALDIDLFGGGDADLAGAAKGIGEVMTGGAKGGAEALKGLEAHGDADVDGGGLWHALGLGEVPMTITMSVIVLLGWTASLLGMHYVVPYAPWLRWVMVPLVVLVSLPLAALVVRPLAPVFAVREGKSNHDYVGHACTITTGSVDDGFGQATIEDGGTVLIIAVRCDRPAALHRGDQALVIDFDSERQAYVVEPQAEPT